MKKFVLFFAIILVAISAKAQNITCPCQTITTNINFNNTSDLECAIMKRVNCLLSTNSKCFKEVVVSRPSDGLVTYQDSNGTVNPYSQSLFNAFIGGIFNNICGSSANPVTPAIVQSIANVIHSRIVSQSSNYLPNKIARIRNLTIIYKGLCCPEDACAYEFIWQVDIVKCNNIEIPNKN